MFDYNSVYSRPRSVRHVHYSDLMFVVIPAREGRREEGGETEGEGGEEKEKFPGINCSWTGDFH